jgi:RNA polymerase sigma factor (sigma-70 family)
MNFEFKENEISVSELLQSCMQGNRKSWDLFFDKFHRLITGVVNQKSSENIDDTIQLIYLRLVENDYKVLRKFNGNSYGAFFLYLKEISKNVVREENKKNFQQNKITDPFNYNEDNLIDPQTLINNDSEEDLNLLMGRIMQLDLAFREVLTLRYLGYKTREIAEILNIPLNTVLTRIKRASEKIKKNNTMGIK